MSIGRKVWGVAIGVLILLLAVGGTLFSLLLQDDSKGVYQEEPSTDLIAKAVAAAGTGQEAEITQKELNGFLENLFQQGSGQEQGKVRLRSLYFRLGEEQGDIAVYAPCGFYGLEIGVTARGDLAFDQQTQTIVIQVEEMKAGRLPVSPGWALSFLKKTLPQGVTIQDSQIRLETKQMDWHLGELGELLEIRNVRVEKGNLYLSTNGMLDALEKYLKQQAGDSRWSGLLDSYGGSIKDFLSGWLQ